MLVETSYISNPSEERRLRNLGQQGRLAEAIAAGVRGYFAQYPPDGTRFKQERRSTLASYLWHAFVGYWVVPAAFLFGLGVLIGAIRRALRRPSRPEVKTTPQP